MRPAEYSFSWYSTVSGRKSTSFFSFALTAVTRMMVSP